jgi:hypothetical protein
MDGAVQTEQLTGRFASGVRLQRMAACASPWIQWRHQGGLLAKGMPPAPLSAAELHRPPEWQAPVRPMLLP